MPADVRSCMEDKGDAILGIGEGRGENRAVDAASHAIDNPLLEDSHIDGAKNILINITGGEDLSLTETEDIISTITAAADPSVKLKYGTVIDPSFDDEIKVTVIATGFPSDSSSIGSAESFKGSEDLKNDSNSDGNYVSISDFKNLNGNGKDYTSSIFSPGGRTANRDGLDVPTAMRTNRINFGKSFDKK